MAIHWLPTVHAVATLLMVGIIWFVQVVHYPLFARVGVDAFALYASEHIRRTSIVVVPLMLVEATTAIALCVIAGGLGMPAWIGLALLGVVWLSTWSLQVPCHRKLEAGFDARVAERLVRTNWLRTVAWSGRAIVAVWLVWNQID